MTDDVLFAAKGRALDAYALVEKHLALLLGALLRLDREVSEHVYDAIQNSQRVSALLLTLFERVHSPDELVFAKSLMKAFQGLTADRNKLAHGSFVKVGYARGRELAHLPTMSRARKGSLPLETLVQFEARAHYLMLAVFYLEHRVRRGNKLNTLPGGVSATEFFRHELPPFPPTEDNPFFKVVARRRNAK
ncbi:MAG: hypothetical protein H6722_30685 [Sandaracinus sp.]|nr:hypothetical protein [Myxococcales bacterium]MCB9599547.1 hypothetical protein [Sandaracinus sp.]MCB9616823.1 hypothetical protein [Sandaracinus sp.]